MRRARWGLTLLWCSIAAAHAQTQPPATAPAPLIRAESSLVWVPALLQDENGTPLRAVDAHRIRLWDNGVAQTVAPIPTEDLPISLVVLMQTGAGAGRYLSSYADLPSLLTKLTGGAVREITFVTFDSHVEEIWDFPNRSDGVEYALTHQHAGDGGAAIRDALSFGVRQLQGEPGRFRRVVLLLSGGVDAGSATTPEGLVEQLGSASTVVYSLVFPGGAKHGAARRSVSPRKAGGGDLDQILAALSLRTAEEVASFTGGSALRFADQRSFNSAMLATAERLQDSTILGFQPTRKTTGFHSLRLESTSPHMQVSGRTAYWVNAAR